MIDTSNKYMVGVKGSDVVILNPPRVLTPADALLLAAWLVALAAPQADTEHGFSDVLEAVQNT